MLLAGDIGGTNARLTLFEPRGKIHRTEVLPSREFASLEAVVRTFLGPWPPRVTAATFGIAGPVVRRRCEATNLPWIVDARKMEKTLHVGRVTLINDLVAIAFGNLSVPARRMHVLQIGTPRRSGENVCTLAAGTGLGEAALVWDEHRFVPLATEGSHADFAPADATQTALRDFAAERYGGHVSVERIASGPGIGLLYDFVREVERVPESARNQRRLEEAADRNAEVTLLGESGASRAASRALDLFTRAYGAEAGNLALKTLATGGVFVAGAISARLAKSLKRRGFLEAFRAKGRFRKLLSKVPVAVVLDPDVGLRGAMLHVRLRA